jgi:hypothetical protein
MCKAADLQAKNVMLACLFVCLMVSVTWNVASDPALVANLSKAPTHVTSFWVPHAMNPSSYAPKASSTGGLYLAGATCSACRAGNPFMAGTNSNSASRCLQQLLEQVWQRTAEQPIAAALHSVTGASADLGLTSDLQDKLAAWVAHKSAQAQAWSQELPELLDPTPQQHQPVTAAPNTKLWVQQAHSSAGNLWLHSSKVVQEPLAAMAASLSSSAQQLLATAAAEQDISAAQAAQLSAVVESKLQETLQEASTILRPAQLLQDATEPAAPAPVSPVPAMEALLIQCVTDPAVDAAMSSSHGSKGSSTVAEECSIASGIRADSHKLLKAVKRMVNIVFGWAEAQSHVSCRVLWSVLLPSEVEQLHFHWVFLVL